MNRILDINRQVRRATRWFVGIALSIGIFLTCGTEMVLHALGRSTSTPLLIRDIQALLHRIPMRELMKTQDWNFALLEAAGVLIFISILVLVWDNRWRKTIGRRIKGIFTWFPNWRLTKKQRQNVLFGKLVLFLTLAALVLFAVSEF